jgi:hypothetical protein
MHVAVWDTTTLKWKDKGNAGTTGNLSVGTVVSVDTLNKFGIITLADKFCTTLHTITTAKDVTCPGLSNGIARVSSSGATLPYTYNWTPIISSSNLVWNLNPGIYQVTTTDSRNCQVSDSVQINNPNSIDIEISVTPSSCNDSVGSAKILASGGSSNFYHYFWIPSGLISDSIGDLPAGVYPVTITDEMGCSIDTFVTISDSNGPEASVEVITNVGCNGYNDGSIQLTVPPGGTYTDPIHICTYASNNTNRLSAGVYPVIVTDSNNCVSIVTANISQPPSLILSITTTESTCGDSTGSATVSVSGGSGNYTYSWSSGGTDSTETNLPSGFDTVTVTDANGCLRFAVAVIEDSDGPTLNANSINLTCYDSKLWGSIDQCGRRRITL